MVSSINFTITGIPNLPFPQINALRVQDVANQVWYEWTNGYWGTTGQPKCKNGGALYIAASFINNGGAGTMTATIKAGTATIQTKSESVAAGASLGIEANTTMPASGNLDCQAVCNP